MWNDICSFASQGLQAHHSDPYFAAQVFAGQLEKHHSGASTRGSSTQLVALPEGDSNAPTLPSQPQLSPSLLRSISLVRCGLTHGMLRQFCDAFLVASGDGSTGGA